VVAVKTSQNGNQVVFIQKKPVRRSVPRRDGPRSRPHVGQENVLIKADRSMKYGDVRKMMDRDQPAGFDSVALVTGEGPRPDRKTEGPSMAMPTGSSGVKSDINVTPFVDIVLVLADHLLSSRRCSAAP